MYADKHEKNNESKEKDAMHARYRNFERSLIENNAHAGLPTNCCFIVDDDKIEICKLLPPTS